MPCKCPKNKRAALPGKRPVGSSLPVLSVRECGAPSVESSVTGFPGGDDRSSSPSAFSVVNAAVSEFR
jgi:hypothetical protein